MWVNLYEPCLFKPTRAPLKSESLIIAFSTVTLSGPRQFFTATKQRIQAKNFVKADNERLPEKDDRSASTGGPRRPGGYRGSGNGYNQKDTDIYMKRMHQARNKREEVVPRFQVICISFMLFST